jgi:hypothetical protein
MVKSENFTDLFVRIGHICVYMISNIKLLYYSDLAFPCLQKGLTSCKFDP